MKAPVAWYAGSSSSNPVSPTYRGVDQSDVYTARVAEARSLVKHIQSTVTDALAEVAKANTAAKARQAGRLRHPRSHLRSTGVSHASVVQTAATAPAARSRMVTFGLANTKELLTARDDHRVPRGSPGDAEDSNDEDWGLDDSPLSQSKNPAPTTLFAMSSDDWSKDGGFGSSVGHPARSSSSNNSTTNNDNDNDDDDDDWGDDFPDIKSAALSLPGSSKVVQFAKVKVESKQPSVRDSKAHDDDDDNEDWDAAFGGDLSDQVLTKALQRGPHRLAGQLSSGSITAANLKESDSAVSFPDTLDLAGRLAGMSSVPSLRDAASDDAAPDNLDSWPSSPSSEPTSPSAPRSPTTQSSPSDLLITFKPGMDGGKWIPSTPRLPQSLGAVINASTPTTGTMRFNQQLNRWERASDAGSDESDHELHFSDDDDNDNGDVGVFRNNSSSKDATSNIGQSSQRYAERQEFQLSADAKAAMLKWQNHHTDDLGAWVADPDAMPLRDAAIRVLVSSTPAVPAHTPTQP